MQKLCDLKFPVECRTLPEGFWSAVDVWIKKPHVVNKRLCGAKESESGNAGAEALRFLLDDRKLPANTLPFLTSGGSPAQAHGEDKPRSTSVRTIIPKVNCYGTTLHKEVILKGTVGLDFRVLQTLFPFNSSSLLLLLLDFGSQQVTFVPFEEDLEGQVCLKRGNIYQIQLLHEDCEEW